MTTPLAKATLQEVGARPPAAQPQPITVQFNPTSLRLQMANNVDMKKAFGKRPAVQYDGTSSSTLSFDLIFDTSDEGTTEQPVDVRTRAKEVERFLLPAKGTKSVPPQVQFSYGTFQLVGVMSTLNQEYDLFAATGVPLRVKLAVTIKEQMPEYEAGRTGPAANTGAGARDDQGLLAGSAPPARTDRTGTALEGESAPDFAARMGLDPAGWRNLDFGGQDPLSLAAGTSVDFSASLSVGLDLSAGVTARVSASAPVLDSREPDPRSVTSAGGLQSAIDQGAGRRAAAAADAQRAGFALPAAPSTAMGAPGPATGLPSRVGYSAAATAGPGAGGLERPAPGPDRPDRRGLTYGSGVPLRPHVRPLTSGAREVPVTDDPTVPRWLALRVPRAAVVTGLGHRCARTGPGGTQRPCRCNGGEQ
ncbi:CIS tube protein [Streptomyces werraensis]|uniref:CIS tube protein n=1 Tax=Streptomyces werraensis TaxID=68284 RepID=UPI00341AB573